MLELVFVLVIVGILSISIIPQLERDNTGEAAYQIARHIRLAQHHALMEDRYDDGNPNWRETMWRITFVAGTSGQCYQVWADRNGNGVNLAANERAVDPGTGDWVWGGTTCADTTVGVNEEVLLWKKFGVTALTKCGNIRNLAFDHLGRPGEISLNTMNLLTADCSINVEVDGDTNATIVVSRDSGYVRVTVIDGVALP